MTFLRFLLLACLVAALAVTAWGGRPTAAQAAGSVSLTLTASTTKARIGEIVQFTATIENTGTETIPNLFVSINYPDAINARGMNCPGGSADQVVTCSLGDLAPGDSAEVLYFAEAGHREPNGPVTASAYNDSGQLASASAGRVKIHGREPR